MALFEWCPLYRGRGAVPASLNTKPPLHKHHQHRSPLPGLALTNKHFIISEVELCCTAVSTAGSSALPQRILHRFSGKKVKEKHREELFVLFMLC